MIDRSISHPEVCAQIENYCTRFRRDDHPPVIVSGFYDLYPDVSSTHTNIEHKWPDRWPNSEHPGVYLIYDENFALQYVGKSSMNSSIGSRLGAYFEYADDKSCRLKDARWAMNPRYIVTVSVPMEMPWEAPALEEYLIRNLNPPMNVVGKNR